MRVAPFASIFEKLDFCGPLKSNAASLGPSHRGNGTRSALDRGQSGYMLYGAVGGIVQGRAVGGVAMVSRRMET